MSDAYHLAWVVGGASESFVGSFGDVIRTAWPT